MKALTIWQPFATLILIGAKPYEFRGWAPPKWLVGKRMAIHAGARPVRAKEIKALIAGLKGSLGLETPCLHKDIALPVLEGVLAGIEQKKEPQPDIFGPKPTTTKAVTLPLGCIIGTATVGEPKRGDECGREFGNAIDGSARDGTFNWGWPMLDIAAVMPPEPMPGAQGLWNWGGA